MRAIFSLQTLFLTVFFIAVLFGAPTLVGATVAHGHNGMHFLNNANVSDDCNATNYYKMANETCGDNVTCSFTPECQAAMTCECLHTYRKCVEEMSSFIDTYSTCPAAEKVYMSVVADFAGSAFNETSAGKSCVALSCMHSLKCDCNSSAYSVDTEAPTATPEATPTPAPTAGGGFKHVVSLTVDGDVATFDPTSFTVSLASAMNVSAETVKIIEISAGSVLVKFYFATADPTASLALANKFITVVATGNNTFTNSYNVLAVSVTIEDTTGKTEAPVNLGTPTPQTKELEGAEFTVGLIVACVVGGIVIFAVVIVVGCICVKRKAKLAAAKAVDNAPYNNDHV